MPPAALFGLDQWERLLLQGAIRPGELRVMLDGTQLDLHKLGIFGPAGRLNPPALARLTRQGASVVHNDLHRLVPGLWDLVCDTARHFREQVGLGLITSFGTRSAFKRHFDQEDLLIVQLEGSKDWRFYGEPVPGPALPRAPDSLPAEISATITMQPGDVLYVPAGQTHECTAHGYSMHLGLLIDHLSPRAAIAQLFDAHADLNEQFHAFLSDAAIEDTAARLKAALLARIEATDMVDWVRQREQKRAAVEPISLKPE
ncbi:MAG: hypothetical protein EOP60_09115 [Sphingomonadales bacterium]|nr:MAG: hypothetical protein EOP60_09115 [Sphingomonadales bacterium]